MKNSDTGLNGEFVISSRKILFLLFFASASSYSVLTFENCYHSQCFTVFTSGRCEWYTVLTSLNKLEIDTFCSFCFICLSQTMTSSLLQKSNVMYVSKEATNRDTSLKAELLLSTGYGKKKPRLKKAVFLEIRLPTSQLPNPIFQKIPWLM